jgi:hypothetical protein
MTEVTKNQGNCSDGIRPVHDIIDFLIQVLPEFSCINCMTLLPQGCLVSLVSRTCDPSLPARTPTERNFHPDANVQAFSYPFKSLIRAICSTIAYLQGLTTDALKLFTHPR